MGSLLNIIINNYYFKKVKNKEKNILTNIVLTFNLLN